MYDSEIEPKASVSFLAFVDIIERLDMLLLESRHLQVTIIHNLRAPAFYRPLRYEEQFIWGALFPDINLLQNHDKPIGNSEKTSWYKLLKSESLNSHDIVNTFMIQYPHPSGIHSGKKILDNQEIGIDLIQITKIANEIDVIISNDIGNTLNTWETIKIITNKRLRNILTTGAWSSDQKRHYYNLISLQVLKRNILLDKLIISRAAISSFEGKPQQALNKKTSFNPSYAYFLLVRSAIMAKVRTYVERLGDLYAQFEKTLDLGILELPRPSIGRRREQGIYTSFLAERSRDLLRETNFLLESINSPNIGNENEDPKKRPIIHHRWAHHFTSTNHMFKDEVACKDNQVRIGSHINFINTSFWMPERPDLQSIIAHEINHTIIESNFHDFDKSFLSQSKDSLSKLVRELFFCFEYLGTNNDSLFKHDKNNPKWDMRELISDLLSTATQGHSYLFALFQESLASGMELLFSKPDGGYLPELNEKDFVFEVDFNSLDFKWYFRLMSICTWLNAITPRRHKTKTGQILTDGIKATLDDIIDYLKYKSNGNSKALAHIKYYESLAKRLCSLMKKSKVVKEINNWQQKKFHAHYTERVSNDPFHLFPRASRCLPEKVRKHLFEILESTISKSQNNSPSSQNESGTVALDYLKKDAKNFFSYLHDVPWQSAIINSIEFTGKQKKNSNFDKWFYKIHWETTFRRELYQLGLEFYLWACKPPNQKLLVVARLLNKANEQGEEIPDIIKNWRGSSSPTRYRLDKLEKIIRNGTQSFPIQTPDVIDTEKKFQEISGNFNANELIEIFQNNNQATGSFNEKENRFLEMIQGQKLAELEKITNESELNEYFNPLKRYLSIYPTNSSKVSYKIIDGKHEQINTKMTFELLFDAMRNLTCVQEGSDKWSLTMLERISLAGPSDEDALDLNEANTIETWDGYVVPCREKRYYSGILGKYDYLSYYSTRAMCRCFMPYFKTLETVEKAGKKKNPSKFVSIVDEKFPPFFSRRELAIPVNISPCLNHNTIGSNFIGLISVVLTDRYTRLDFVARLLAGKLEKNPNVKISCIDHLGNLLNDHDAIFLTEGWGDVLIMLNDDKGVDRLEDLFLMQDILFEDFQVDHTEIVLSTSCVEKARIINQKKDGQYNLTVQIRLMEDRDLGQGNQCFVNQVNENISTHFKGNRPFYLLEKTPGNTDFTFHFNGKMPDSFNYLDLLKLLDKTKLDLAQSTIGQVMREPSRGNSTSVNYSSTSHPLIKPATS